METMKSELKKRIFSCKLEVLAVLVIILALGVSFDVITKVWLFTALRWLGLFWGIWSAIRSFRQNSVCVATILSVGISVFCLPFLPFSELQNLWGCEIVYNWAYSRHRISLTGEGRIVLWLCTLVVVWVEWWIARQKHCKQEKSENQPDV